MQKAKLLAKLKQIDRECEKNPELNRRLEPFAKKHMANPSFDTIVLLINEYEKVKSEL